ncbi:DUF1508 domain-containing protein [Sinomonas atrocyanea]|uniref:YegP family protein n=1 Tax=Sinomonas atrocyanea TaxID=37927 RepID=UPI0027834BC0|nr:DUF1508 domain-containing protein [Sinomonas atrocyanea]MDP9886428.1 uncharacterized protein YegP (UPF0339 family) [Sinomonas atrocyanea]MDR6623647.1 uncharacterized protein YegP (UPF0339 family) [Sinomonas atrocyanea]
MAKRIIYRRNDGKWGWRLQADDGRIIATDGSPGYDNESDARHMAEEIIGGHFSNAEKTTIGDIGPERIEPGAPPGT